MSLESASFSSQLLAWYSVNKRDLPWRKTSDPYKIWISEIMLQQTTVTAVIPYFEKWIKTYPTMQKLASVSEQDVMNSWEGLGYYSRVRNIHKSAKIMVEKYGGMVPDDPKLLIKLPGFGSYTVGAVLSIAYGKRLPVIDANVRRIVMRMKCIKGKADASVDPDILPWIEKNLPGDHMSEFNQAFMELGALICGKQPQCLQCPVKGFCKAYEKGMQDEIPVPKKVTYVDVDVVAVVLRQGDKVYIRKKSGKGVLSGLWDFPSDRKHAEENGLMAARRIAEQLCGYAPDNLCLVGQVRHYYTNHRVKLTAYLCDVTGGVIQDEFHQLVSLSGLNDYAMHSGAVKITEKLHDALT